MFEKVSSSFRAVRNRLLGSFGRHLYSQAQVQVQFPLKVLEWHDQYVLFIIY